MLRGILESIFLILLVAALVVSLAWMSAQGTEKGLSAEESLSVQKELMQRVINKRLEGALGLTYHLGYIDGYMDRTMGRRPRLPVPVEVKQ